MKKSKKSEDKRIMERALALYSRYGIKSITMDDLCRELGISKKTLYIHVVDKNDLIRKVIEYEMEIHQEMFDRMVESELNAIDELIHVNKQIHSTQRIHSPTFYFDLKKYHPEIYREWLDYKRRKTFELIRRNLNKGMKEGLYREEMNPDIISKLHMARTEMLHTSDIIKDNELAGTTFIDEVFTYHLHGICNGKGLDYLKSRQPSNDKQ